MNPIIPTTAVSIAEIIDFDKPLVVTPNQSKRFAGDDIVEPIIIKDNVQSITTALLNTAHLGVGQVQALYGDDNGGSLLTACIELASPLPQVNRETLVLLFNRLGIDNLEAINTADLWLGAGVDSVFLDWYECHHPDIVNLYVFAFSIVPEGDGLEEQQYNLFCGLMLYANAREYIRTQYLPDYLTKVARLLKSNFLQSNISSNKLLDRYYLLDLVTQKAVSKRLLENVINVLGAEVNYA